MATVGVSTDATYSYRDRSGEISRTTIHYEPLDDSGDNSSVIGALGAVSVVGTLLNALTDCTEAGTNLNNKVDVGSPGLPVSEFAQRELAARMRYQDNVTGKYYRFDIPGPINALIQAGTDAVDMDALAMVAFKVAFDADARSEVGNAVTLLDGKIVGRRS